MKTIFRKLVKMPSYALPYIINEDSSGISEEDQKIINSGICGFERIADKNNSTVIYSPLDEEYFTAYPLFGLPCNVVDCEIIILR